MRSETKIKTENSYHVRLVGGPLDGATCCADERQLQEGCVIINVTTFGTFKYIVAAGAKNKTAKAYFELPNVY